MARPNKKQHTVPRIYLQAFANADGKVWVTDEHLKVFSEKPENILTERDYYTIKFPSGGGTLEVETKYLNGIEGSYADIFREKIAKRLQITQEEKAKLSIFIASMIQRQEMSRNALQKFSKDVKEMVIHLRGLPDSAKKQIARMPTFPTSSPSIPADELLKLLEDVGSLHSSLIPETVPGIASIIFNMKWRFVVRPKNSLPFITSNNPCVMVNPVTEKELGRGKMGSLPGLSQKDVELTLPLSSDVALICSWNATNDGAYVLITPDLVSEFNIRVRRHARTIVGSDKNMLGKIVEKLKSLMSPQSQENKSET